jgi:hypothetical protein
MNRLQTELSRLYLPPGVAQAQEAKAPLSTLVGPSNTVRAMVMELTRPPSWELLSRVWQGVQSELELPAPAIAVSGTDALQLWFSLEEPVAVPGAHAFLERLRQRFLPDVEGNRVRLMPTVDAMAQGLPVHAGLVPALHEQTGNWSAFVAPDLAPVFAESPWLDIPPSEEGQASLLRGIAVTTPGEFAAACRQLGAAVPSVPAIAAAPAGDGDPMAFRPAVVAPDGDAPRQFLLRVMNDDTVALALRIEAAKALLLR